MWKLQEDIIGQEDRKYLTEFIKSTGRFTQSQEVKSFESKWSRWQGRQFSTFVNSGSSADLVMLDAVKEYHKIPDGSEVIVPAVTWTTNITSVIQVGLKPVFVDVNLEDLSFDYDKIESAVTARTRIILVTHLIGIPADMERLAAIAKAHNLIILEDCCESHGANIDGKKIGNFGEASTFSFYWGHHMTSIEGGMICTDDEGLNDLFILKRSHGLARELDMSKHVVYREKFPEIDFNFLFLTHGYNVRNTEIHAALGSRQLSMLDNYIEIRNRNYDLFVHRTKVIKDKLYTLKREGISSFCLPFVFKDKADRDKLHGALSRHEIESRPIIGGNLLRQPCFSKYGQFQRFPNAEIVHRNGFYIGNNQFVDEDRFEHLEHVLAEVF